MNSVYLDDYSNEEKIDHNIMENELNNQKIENKSNKPGFNLKPDYNSKGERIVVFSINIPLKKENDALTIDILINDDMYKNIGNHFKS
jgi:hypothetical protein